VFGRLSFLFIICVLFIINRPVRVSVLLLTSVLLVVFYDLGLQIVQVIQVFYFVSIGVPGAVARQNPELPRFTF
jgi:hypothetical protein